MRTQSAPSVNSFGRAIGLAASILLLVLLGLNSPANAQEDGNQAGLVVQFGDGSVQTACVDLGPDGEATGEEVLRDSGLATLIDYTSGFGGGTVCKVGDEGCDFPTEKCFCQCTMKPGDPCIYWIYFHLLDGQWRYSSQSLSSYLVRAGDVEAWVWQAGSSETGGPPPLISFDQICGTLSQPTLPPQSTEPAPPTSAPTSLPTFTSTVLPPRSTSLSTSTALPPSSPSPTPSTRPTETPAPTATSIRGSSPATPVPSVDNASQSKSSYVVFGVLVVVLVGGLIFMRTR